jgi:hypothetical protein
MAGRALSTRLRELGVGGGGNAPMTKEAKSRFLSALDTAAQALLRKRLSR